MVALKTVALLSLVAAPMALAASGVPSGSSCGGHTFSSNDIARAINAGVSSLNSGNKPGGYAHQYYDYPEENIQLVCGNSPWYEFPLFNSKTYTGGSPGAYRAIFQSSGAYCATVYHPSTSGNSFAQCSDS